MKIANARIPARVQPLTLERNMPAASVPRVSSSRVGRGIVAAACIGPGADA